MNPSTSDELEKQLQCARAAGDAPQAIGILNRLADACAANNQHTKRIRWLLELLPYYDGSVRSEAYEKLLAQLGQSYSSLPDYEEAATYYFKLRDYYRMLGDDINAAHASVNLGKLYRVRGELDTCVMHLRDALGCYENHFEVFENPEMKAQRLAYYSAVEIMGIVYGQLGEAAKSRENLEKALAFYQDAGFTNYATQCLVNLGASWSEDDSSLSFQYYNQALKMAEENDNRLLIAVITSNIGGVHEDLGDFESALESYRKAYNLSVQNGLSRYNSYFLKNIGDAYIKSGHPDLAMHALTEALDWAREMDAQMEVQTICMLLSKACRELKRYKAALEYYEQSMETKERIRQEEARAKMERISAEFDLKLHQREAELLRRKNAELEMANSLLHNQKEEMLVLERRNSALAMAVTASHEINQPLMIIQGNLDLLDISLKPDLLSDKQRLYFVRLRDAIARIQHILLRYTVNTDIDFHQYGPDTPMVVFPNEEQET